MAYRALERLLNLEDGYRRCFRVDDLELLLVQEGGERYLVERRCPHAGQSLDRAPVEAGTLSCPRHHVTFSLVDGQPQPPICRALKRYALVYEGNSIGIDIPA